MRTVSVLIPVFNNSEALVELHQRITAVLQAPDRPYEIIFVNDGSTDDSLKILRRLAAADSRVVVLALSRNFGQHPAIRAGLERCRGDVIVLMDADLQDLPEELPRILEPFDTGTEIDIAYTTFTLAPGSNSRITSRLFHKFFARLSNIHLPSNVGTYRAFSSLVREALLDYPERHAVYGPIMAQMGFERIFVEVSRSAAVGRKTSYTFRRRLSLAVSSLISYSSALHRMVTWIGFVLTLASTGYLFLIVAQYFIGTRKLLNGQFLLLGITLLMSGVMLMTVGVLTAYTYRIFHEVLERPRYHIAREFGQYRNGELR